MPKFRIAGPDSLLTAMVASLVRERYGDASIEVRNGPPHDGLAGVRVELVGKGRWLYVSPGRGGTAGAVEALSEGATAVLHIESTPDDFELALTSVVTGERGFVPVDIMRWMAGEALGRRGTSPAVLKVSLTQREREILQLVARGFSNQEIAEALGISTNTVRSHLHTLSVKLDATSRTKMLANARALAIPEALEFGHAPGDAGERVPA